MLESKCGLYNIKNDLGQQNDLADSEPQRLAELREIMVKLHRDAIDEGPVWDLQEAKPEKHNQKR